MNLPAFRRDHGRPPTWASCSFDDGDLVRYWTVIGEVPSVEHEPIVVEVVRFDYGFEMPPVVEGEPFVRAGEHYLPPEAARTLAAKLVEAAATLEAETPEQRSGLARIITMSRHP